MILNKWSIIQDKYNCLENKKYETLFTLANGYRGLRGALEFSNSGQRGNFVSGVFDKHSAQVTEIVNLQDPLTINIYIENELVNIDNFDVLYFKRELNMKEGVLYTNFHVKTPIGKEVKISAERFISRADVHRWGAKYVITPVNFKGKIFIENIIDGRVINSEFDPVNKTKHFIVNGVYDLKPGIALKTQTFDNKIEVIEASVLKTANNSEGCFKTRVFGVFGELVREVYEIFVEEGYEYVVYKYGTTYTSRDTENSIYNLCVNNLDEFLREGYEAEKNNHIKKWKETWDNIDIKIEGDVDAQTGIRFNLFHLASSAYEGDDRISIAAKALHGEGYKGHVFWDTEIFMLPFFIYTMPHVAKNLLMYRYNTLDGARENAKLNGYKGAQFPWESADTGLEVTPKWGFDYDGNPIRIWTGDEEYHINSDITFAIWEYYRATEDKEFLKNYGMEIFLSTSKFWESRLEYNAEKDRYEINKVIGPDEFHEHVNNNAYTNYLAKWSINKTLELIEWMKKEDSLKFEKLCNYLGLCQQDFNKWSIIKDKIFIPVGKDGKLIEQFEGYFDLVDIKITEFDNNGMPIWPNFKGHKLHETMLVKQADVVMLMLLLPEEFDSETKKVNYEFYEKRTMHKSSLSPSMYSIMGLSVGDAHNAYRYFMKTIMTDLEDNQGNAEFGIHAASTGGAWQSAVFGFGGFSVDKEGKLNFNPWIPEKWNELSFNIKWKESKINVSITHNSIKITSTETISVKVFGKEYIVDKEIYLKI
jgi:kojibiose phosphorylase